LGALRGQVALALLCVLACLSASPGHAQDTPEALLKRIIAGWQKRQSLATTAVWIAEGVGYRRRGWCSDFLIPSTPIAPGTGPVPAEDVHFPIHMRLYLDFARMRVRKEWVYYSCQQDERTGALEPYLLSTIQVFDGRNYIWFDPPEKNPQRGRVSPSLEEITVHQDALWTFDSEQDPVFLAHGLIGEGPTPSRLKVPLQPAHLTITAQATYQGRACVIVRAATSPGNPDDFDDLWVDVERDGAVLRYVRFIGGQYAMSTNIEYAGQHGTWLPIAAQHATSSGAGCTLRFTNIELNTPFDPALFRVIARPGMRIGSDGGVFVAEQEGDVLMQRPRPGAATGSGGQTYVLWGGLIATAMYACYWAYRAVVRSRLGPTR
jgi:hypothetical protein